MKDSWSQVFCHVCVGSFLVCWCMSSFSSCLVSCVLMWCLQFFCMFGAFWCGVFRFSSFGPVVWCLEVFVVGCLSLLCWWCLQVSVGCLWCGVFKFSSCLVPLLCWCSVFKFFVVFGAFLVCVCVLVCLQVFVVLDAFWCWCGVFKFFVVFGAFWCVGVVSSNIRVGCLLVCWCGAFKFSSCWVPFSVLVWCLQVFVVSWSLVLRPEYVKSKGAQGFVV